MAGHAKSLIDKSRGTLSEKITSPIAQFMGMEVSGGILLVIVTIIAMAWANSPFAEGYFHFFHTPVAVTVGNMVVEHSLLHWINDLLMAVFFFVVGLEIKREMVTGELSSWKQASLPMIAALGGMVAPAIIYYVLNPSGVAASGWGIPMATDIAFAVGIMMLLGNRVPFALKIFLLALAIVDDLGAILVIALFYTKNLSIPHLLYAFGGILAILGLRAMGVWRKIPYILVGGFMWLMVLKSGVHATVAGVVLGFLTPAYPIVNRKKMFEDLGMLMDRMKNTVAPKLSSKNDEINEPLEPETKALVDDIKYVAHEAESPLDGLMHILHPWVTFLIMPIFALGNAGIALGGVAMGDIFASNVALGIMLGLFVGKPVGIVLFSWLAVKLKVSSLPAGVNWTAYFGMSCLAGIGFTMALFIGNLALGGSAFETYAKLGILIGSLLSAVVGYVALHQATKGNAEKKSLADGKKSSVA